MENLKVKKEFIGSSTSLDGIGQITINEGHAGVLAKAGRWELLEGNPPNVKKLEPIKTKKSTGKNVTSK